MAERITIVGCGPGSPEYLSAAAIQAAELADVLVGAQRLLDMFPNARGERIPLGSTMGETLDAVADRLPDHRVVVLVSGDPGLFSLARLVVRRFGRKSCRIIPGISSVQAAFASIGLDWADAAIVSAHKAIPEGEPDSELKDRSKIAVLAGRSEALPWIAQLVNDLGGDRRIFVCEDLTLETERVQEVSPGELAGLRVSSRTVVLILQGDIPA